MFTDDKSAGGNHTTFVLITLNVELGEKTSNYFIVTSAQDVIDNSLLMPIQAHHFAGSFRESRRTLDRLR